MNLHNYLVCACKCCIIKKSTKELMGKLYGKHLFALYCDLMIMAKTKGSLEVFYGCPVLSGVMWQKER